MRRRPFASRSLASLLSLVLVWTPFGLAVSGDIEEGARQGRETGQQARPDRVPIERQGNSDTYTLGSGEQGERIRIQELFPGTGERVDTDRQRSLYGGDNDALPKKGRSKNESLEEPGTTPESNAYEVVRDSEARQPPDFQSSPLGRSARQAHGNPDLISEEFAGCKSETNLEDREATEHVPEMHVCKRTLDKTKTCTLKHGYTGGIVAPHRGPWNTKPCGRGCQLLWIGRVGNNYWGGYCSIYTQRTDFKVLAPDAIDRARLVRAKWDDYMQVYVGSPGGNFQKVWQGPGNAFAERPPRYECDRNHGRRGNCGYTGPRCELNTSWDRSLSVDVTNIFRSVDPGDVVRFKVRVSVAGKGEGYARLRINYDTGGTIKNDKWTPESCLEPALGLDDGVATGTVRCTKKPATNRGCAVIDGFTICPRDLDESPLPGISRLCREAAVDVEYPAAGADGESIDTCKKYEKDPNCGFVSSECAKGAKGDETGECYIQMETWDCGKDVTYTETVAETRYQCGGAIRCMGDECAKPSGKTSGSFQRAASLLEAADYMMMDAECNTSADTQQNVDLKGCEVFKGNANECKQALDGYKNCCKNPSGPSLKDYLSLMQAIQKVDQAAGISNAILQTQGGQALQGAWEKLASQAESVWTNITQEFSSAFNSITGNTAANVSEHAASASAESFKGTLTQKTAQWVGKTFGKGAQRALFGESLATLGGKGAVAGNVIAGVMTAYTYYMIAKAIINIVFKCEEHEMKLAGKKALRSCHKVGTYCSEEIISVCVEEQHAYCCFNSPLSRIMQEQIKQQFGTMGWGSPENPDCGGINPRMLAKVDWDKVDLSEWTAILADTGNLPDPGTITAESLTGTGNVLDEGTESARADVTERTRQRVEQVQVDQERGEAEDELQGSYPAYEGE